jgi:hypothetical protein
VLVVERDDAEVADADLGRLLQELLAPPVVHSRERLVQHRVHFGLENGPGWTLPCPSRCRRSQAGLSGEEASMVSAPPPARRKLNSSLRAAREKNTDCGIASTLVWMPIYEHLRDGLCDLLVVHVAIVRRVQRQPKPSG